MLEAFAWVEAINNGKMMVCDIRKSVCKTQDDLADRSCRFFSTSKTNIKMNG